MISGYLMFNSQADVYTRNVPSVRNLSSRNQHYHVTFIRDLIKDDINKNLVNITTIKSVGQLYKNNTKA